MHITLSIIYTYVHLTDIKLGVVSCHNPGHKDVPPSTTWYSGGYINAIWGWHEDVASIKEISDYKNDTQPILTDTVISCGAYQGIC